MARIKLNITASSKPMSDEVYSEVTDLSFDNHGNGIEITPHYEEGFPIPWDAECWIENNKFILDGGAGPSGFGHCRTEIPLKSVSSVLDLEIFTDNAQAEEDLRAILGKYGWL